MSKKLLTFLTLLTLFFGVGWADTAVFAFGSMGFSTTEHTPLNDVTLNPTSGSGVTLLFNNGTNTSYAPQYNKNKYLQFYANNTLLIDAGTNTITQVDFVFSSNYTLSSCSCTSGSYVDDSNNGSGTWTGSTSSLTITNTKGSQARLLSITVTYTAGGSSGPSAPTGTISFNPIAGEVTSGTKIAISCTGSYDGIKYTTNGDTPDASHGTVYNASDKPTITATTIIKAAAYNTSNSQYAFGTVATAEYTVASSGGTEQTATLSNANIVSAGDGLDGYRSWTLTDENSKTWNAYAIKKSHSSATSNYHFLQIRGYNSSGPYYIQVPEYGIKITKLEMTVSSTQTTMTGGGNTATLFFSSSNTTSSSGTGVASGTGSSKVTIDCSNLNLNTGYITASAGVRIWDVIVTYEEEVAGTYSITKVCDPTAGGSINCSKSSSNGNEVITFTVSTNDNYEFEYVDVKDADDNSVEISVSNGTYSFTMPTKDVTITAHFNVAGSLYILGQVNGNDAVSWDSHKGVKMNYSNGVYTANVFVSAADGGGYFAFRTVLANWGTGYDGSRWGSESGNWLFSEGQPNGNATLVNGSDQSFRLPNGIYQFTVNINNRSLVVTKVDNATVTISPNGGDIKKGSTATITESGLSTFLSSCQSVINSSNQTVTSGITVPSVKIYYSTDGNNFTEGDTYTFEQSQEVALTGKAAIVATTVTNNNTIELAQATKQATFRVKYGIAVAEGLSGGNIGNISPSSKLAYEDDEVSFKVNPNGGYQIASVTVTTDGGQTITATAGANNTYTFSMPADHVTLSAAFTAIVYNITLNNDNTKGTATLSATTATAGTAITVTVTPKTGYTVESVTATKAGGGTINVTDNQNGTYTFGMQSDNVVVAVNYSEVSSEPSDLFHESFGNASSAREWDDSYSVKTGVAEVYSGITGYTVTGAKQSKNTTGYIESGLMQSAGGTEASIIMGPLNVENYKDLVLSYYWKAASTSGSYSTSLYYATSANGSYSTVSGTGNGASSYVKCTYNLPEAAQVSTLYLKIVFNTSNTNAFIDEVNLAGVPNSITPSLQAPVITPEGGVFLNSEYPDGVTVTIAPVTDGSTVYYTTDGTEPSAANGTEITASTTITVTTTTTVQAIAILGDEASEVVSETYNLVDVILEDVQFSPIPGTYSGAQTLQMYTTTQNAKIYYEISDAGEPGSPNTSSTLYSNTDVINLLPGHTYQVKAIAYVGNNCSEIASGTYVINTASSSALNSIAELNSSATDQVKTLGNPIQIVYMSTWRHLDGTNNTVATPEYAYVRDNTGYGLIYFRNDYYHYTSNGVVHDNPNAVQNALICNMGDWLPGNIATGTVKIWSDGFHNELGGSSYRETITSWPTSTTQLVGNTPIIPEEMTNANINAGWDVSNSFATAFNAAFNHYCDSIGVTPDNLTNDQKNKANAYAIEKVGGYSSHIQPNNVWGHYVHLRKNTIEVTDETNPSNATPEGDETNNIPKRHKYSGFVTDQSGEKTIYYDGFYLFSGYNGTQDLSNDYFQSIQENGGTFDVYGIVGFYGPYAADAEHNYIPFEILPIDFLHIYKPIIHMGANDYNDADPVTTLESQTVTITCATEGATIYYKTSDMEDYAVYTPGTEITVDATTTIEAYSSIPTKYNDVMESVVNSLTINIGSIEAPVVTEPSVVKTVGESVTTDITCTTEGATIYYTTDGSDPKTSETRQVYSSALTFEETTTVRAIAYKVVEGTGYYSAEAEARTYTFVKSNGIVYDLVTDQTQLNESSVFIVVNKANHMAMGNTQDANHRDAAGVKFVDEETKVQVYGNDDVAQFTLKKVGNNWYMQTTNSNVNGYLYVSDGNMLLTEATADANAEATINIDADAEHQAHISFMYNHETTRYLRYWNGGQAFNTYTSETSNLPVSLYYIQATPLANIEKEGTALPTTNTAENQYTIADELIIVHALGNLLWVKDQGNVSISKTEPSEDQIDYMQEVAPSGVYEGATVLNQGDRPWDQSNWIILEFDGVQDMSEYTSTPKAIKPATLTGHYVDGENYRMIIPAETTLQTTDCDESYMPNVYCPANFLDANLEGDGPQGAQTEEHYFFMNPKIQEVAIITYAVWDGANFVVPKSQGIFNQGDFDGAFSVAWDYNALGQVDLTEDEAYQFRAVLNKKASGNTTSGAKVTPKPGMTPDDTKVVYPLNLSPSGSIVTAVTDVTGKAVAGVKYYNLAGIESDRPFEGVNIIVTTYTDGSRSSSKVLK